MKILNLCLFTTLFSRARTSLMPTKRICRDCIHFIGNNIECGKFGDTNIITGIVTYDSARSIRGDEKKCGENAVYFEENHFKIVTVPYYFIKDSWPIIFSVSITTGIYFFFQSLIS